MLAKNIFSAFKFIKKSPIQKQLATFSSRDSQKNSWNTSANLTTNHALSKNIGLNQFLTKVYSTTGFSLLGALGTSYAVLSIPALTAVMMPLSLGGAVATLVGLISTSFMKTTIISERQQINGESVEILKSVNGPLRKAMYTMGVIGLGLGAAPLFAYASMISPTIVPTCLGLTAAIFGGASLAAYSMPKDSMLKYGRVLGGSLLGLIGLQLIGLASTFIIGPNPYTLVLFKASNYISVALFTAMIAYDTHASIAMYEAGQPDHLGMATQFILDFWNILTSLLRIFSD